MAKTNVKKRIILITAVLVFLACEFLVSNTGFNNRFPGINIVIFTLIGAALACAASRLFPDPKKALVILAVAYFGRVILSALGIYTVVGSYLPYYFGDDLEFIKHALMYYEDGIYWPYTHYTDFITVVMYLFGTGRMVIQLFNVYLFIALAAIIEAVLGRRNISEKTQYAVLIFESIFPLWVFLGVSLNRDCFIIVFIGLSFMFFDRWMQADAGETASWIMTFVCLIPAIILHAGIMFVALPYIAISAVYNRKTRRPGITPMSFIVLIPLALAVVAVVISITCNQKLDGLFSLQKQLDDLNLRYDLYSFARANYLVDWPRETVSDMLTSIPVRMLYFLLSPLPTEWYAVKDVASFVMDSLIYLVIFGLCIRRMIKSKKAEFAPCLYVSLYILQAVFFALYVNNSATAMRHRCKLLPVALVCLAYIFEDFFNRRKQHEKA